MRRWEVTMVPPPPLKGTWTTIQPASVEVVEADYVNFTSGCAVFRLQGSSTCYPKTVAVFPVHAFLSIKRLGDEDPRT